MGGLAKRVVVALDVRSNDAGDLVVTKGDQYDVREGGTASGGEVRRDNNKARVSRQTPYLSSGILGTTSNQLPELARIR